MTATKVDRRAEEVFALARTVIQSTWPYLTTAVMRLQPRWDARVPTLGVDKAGRLYLNPGYVGKLSVPALALLIAGHELQHLLGDHADRLVHDRDGDVGAGALGGGFANVCHDLAINSGLQAFVDSAQRYRAAAGGMPLPFEVPKDGVYPHQFCDCRGQPLPVGLISEEYAELLRHAKKPPPRCGGGSGAPAPDGKDDTSGAKGKPERRTCGSGGGDQKQPWEDGDPDPHDPTTGMCAAELEAVKQAVAVAAVEQEAKQRGTVPGGLKLWAEAHLKPSKIPWRRLLRKAVRESINRLAGQTDYTWSRVGRRSPPDVLLPGMIDPEPDFVLLVDTSGSMGPKDYDAAFREIHATLKTVGFRKVPVLVCDTRLSEVQMISDVTQIKMVGGGGTDMRVGIAKAEEMKKKLVIVVTDGFTEWPREPTRVKVIVCLTRDGAAHPPEWMTTVVCDD